MGLFTAPNSAGVMNSLPPAQRGAGAGMLATFTSSAARALDRRLLLADDRRALRPGCRTTLHDGLVAHGVPAADATRISHLPPVSTLFASFLGYNPVADAARPARPRARLPPAQAHALTGRELLPAPDLGPVPHGARLRVRVRDRRLPRRRGRLAPARRQVPPRRGAPAVAAAEPPTAAHAVAEAA